MWIHKLIQSLTPGSSRRRPICPRRRASRLHFEPLEERRLLAFSPSVDYYAGLAAEGLVAADFNNDGQCDLATSVTGNGIGVLIGNGDGAFQPIQLSGLGGGRPVVASDLNGDARIDLVTMSDNLYVLLGNGDGTFQPPAESLSLPSQLPPGNVHPNQTPISAAVGDLNDDGKMDLVVAGYETEEIVYGEVFRQHDYVHVLLGGGDGTFDASTAYHLASTDNTLLKPSVLAMGDFAGDGHPDVLMSVQGSQMLLVGNGDGTLQTPPLPGSFEELAGGEDVNADGIADALALIGIVTWYSDSEATTARTARVQLGNSDGSLAPPVASSLGTAQAASYFGSRVLADFDGNGFPELAVVETRYTGGLPLAVVSVARNDGNWSAAPTPPPTIAISDATVAEGNSGTRAATFTVTLSAAYDQPVTVAYATANGTATSGGDYQAASGALTIPAGQTTGTIAVLINGDRAVEPNETFFMNLSNPANATIADGQASGTIIDDDVPLTISISDVSRTAGKRGKTTYFTFTVTLSSASDQPVTMSFKTVNGTAKTSNNDYIAKTGTITFAPGETVKTITISVKGDSKRESNEIFYLDLYGLSSNALFTKNRGLGTILNDD